MKLSWRSKHVFNSFCVWWRNRKSRNLWIRPWRLELLIYTIFYVLLSFQQQKWVISFLPLFCLLDRVINFISIFILNLTKKAVAIIQNINSSIRFLNIDDQYNTTIWFNIIVLGCWYFYSLLFGSIERVIDFYSLLFSSLLLCLLLLLLLHLFYYWRAKAQRLWGERE